ncbi:hypothetical protein ILUMI_06414 [Ignelater luminosus]|uniref:Uncharacterized protein n=1 Tax=Ignelater luminosus TaxID=2038154 RepID=A0A8K0GFE3_IGNLU|nr:hypothetical protein ILUMI_06414 [Ignelater luminosus]
MSRSSPILILEIISFGILFLNLMIDSQGSSVGCLGIGHYTSAKELKWKKMDEDCIKELNLNKTLIETISNELIIPEDNTALNSFLSCTWKNEGTLNENDEINWDKVEKTFATSLQQELQELPTLDAIIAGGATASAIKLCKEDDEVHFSEVDDSNADKNYLPTDTESGSICDELFQPVVLTNKSQNRKEENS